MQIFVALLDWQDWDDMRLFTTVENAQKYIVKQVQAHIERLGSDNMDDYLYYTIGMWSGDEVLEEQGVIYEMRDDFDSDEWMELMANPNTDPSVFFKKVE